jgi:hypothetical protein
MSGIIDQNVLGILGFSIVGGIVTGASILGVKKREWGSGPLIKDIKRKVYRRGPKEVWYDISGKPRVGPSDSFECAQQELPNPPTTSYWDIGLQLLVDKPCPTLAPDIYMRRDTHTHEIKLVTCLPENCSPIEVNTKLFEEDFRKIWRVNSVPSYKHDGKEDKYLYYLIKEKRTHVDETPLCQEIGVKYDGNITRPNEKYSCGEEKYVTCPFGSIFDWITMDCHNTIK